MSRCHAGDFGTGHFICTSLVLLGIGVCGVHAERRLERIEATVDAIRANVAPVVTK